jgi:thiol:disulfide interchange protein DsbA
MQVIPAVSHPILAIFWHDASMNRRNCLQVLAALAPGSLLASGVLAQVAGKDYIALSPPHPGGSNGQVEVIEFFSFACPHCKELEPFIQKWRAAQPKDVVFRRVPVSFGRPDWTALARVYVTLSTMGLADKLDGPIFDAIHKNHVNLSEEKTRGEWLVKQGVDLRKYNDASRSFGVDSLVKRAEQLTQSYKVTSVPSLYVDGRYAVEATSLEGLLKNTDLVVAKARAEKAR